MVISFFALSLVGGEIANFFLPRPSGSVFMMTLSMNLALFLPFLASGVHWNTPLACLHTDAQATGVSLFRARHHATSAGLDLNASR